MKITQLRAKQNLWAKVATWDDQMNVLATVEQPDEPELTEAEWERDEVVWVPVYSRSRVTGDRYQPYSGGSDWAAAANEAMASRANANFRRENMY